MMLLAVALLVLGVVFFVQKTAKPSVSVIMLLASLALGAGAFAFGDSGSNASGGATSDATVTITSPADGDNVPAGEELPVEVSLRGAELTTATASNDPTQGHLHVFVDGEVISMPTTTASEVVLEPGEHSIAVEFTRADHRSFDPPVIDEIEVTAQ
jgi:hypothetical protein